VNNDDVLKAAQVKFDKMSYEQRKDFLEQEEEPDSRDETPATKRSISMSMSHLRRDMNEYNKKLMERFDALPGRIAAAMGRKPETDAPTPAAGTTETPTTPKTVVTEKPVVKRTWWQWIKDKCVFRRCE
jgi:hypothetical protein